MVFEPDRGDGIARFAVVPQQRAELAQRLHDGIEVLKAGGVASPNRVVETEIDRELLEAEARPIDLRAQ